MNIFASKIKNQYHYTILLILLQSNCIIFSSELIQNQQAQRKLFNDDPIYCQAQNFIPNFSTIDEISDYVNEQEKTSLKELLLYTGINREDIDIFTSKIDNWSTNFVKADQVIFNTSLNLPNDLKIIFEKVLLTNQRPLPPVLQLKNTSPNAKESAFAVIENIQYKANTIINGNITIAVNSKKLERCSNAQKRHIFLHELQHIRGAHSIKFNFFSLSLKEKKRPLSMIMNDNNLLANMPDYKADYEKIIALRNTFRLACEISADILPLLGSSDVFYELRGVFSDYYKQGYHELPNHPSLAYLLVMVDRIQAVCMKNSNPCKSVSLVKKDCSNIEPETNKDLKN